MDGIDSYGVIMKALSQLELLNTGYNLAVQWCAIQLC